MELPVRSVGSPNIQVELYALPSSATGGDATSRLCVWTGERQEVLG